MGYEYRFDADQETVKEILQTVATPKDLTEEIRYLLSVFDG